MLKVTPKQKTALGVAYHTATELAEINSVVNDVLRPMAKKLKKADYPKAFNGVIPANDDPIAWGAFTEQVFGFADQDPIWNWLFSHEWTKFGAVDAPDTLTLELLGKELDEAHSVETFSAAVQVIIAMPHTDEALALPIRVEVVSTLVEV